MSWRVAWCFLFQIMSPLQFSPHVTTFRIRNTSWIASKTDICKSKFNVCYHFLDIYENPRRKSFINLSCPKHPEIIHWNKKWHKFLFSHFFVVPQKGFINAGRPFILEFISNNSGTFRGLRPNNTTHILSEFISSNSDTFKDKMKNNTKNFLLEFISNNTDTFREILPNKTQPL